MFADSLKSVISVLSGAEKRLSLTSTAGWPLGIFGGTAAGKNVTPETSLQISAVMSAIRLLSDTIGSLPLNLKQRISENETRDAREHTLYSVMHDAVSPTRTSAEWRATSQAWLGMFGNAYAIKMPLGAGETTSLIPWHPSSTKVENDPKKGLQYRLMTTEGEKVFGPENVLHLRGLVVDSEQLVGLSPIAFAKETLGATSGAEEHGARLFGAGAMPGGAIEVDDDPGEAATKAILKDWKQNYGSSSKAHGTVILPFGMKYKPFTIPNSDSQWIEFRRFAIDEIARIFRVPPHMIGNVERATDNNVEKQGLEFLAYSLLPWLVRWEQALNLQMLTARERASGLFFRFNVNALLRADSKTQSEAFGMGRQWGWWSANDVRKKLGENPIENGDEYLVPLNMVPAGEPRPEPTALSAARSEARAPFLSDIGERLVRALSRDVRGRLGAARQANLADFAEDLADIEAKAAAVAESLVTNCFHNGGAETFGRAMATGVVTDIRDRLVDGGGRDGIEALVKEWESGKAKQISAALAAAMVEE